uniref:Uncharacterized protein n=1 Tax=viral metagenome TaxID=1070528 RepID=A0A6C0KUH7_9ZZZZ
MSKKEEECDKTSTEIDTCYSFKDIVNNEGFYDSCIDGTYVIHLEGNEERIKNVNEQLEIYKPSKNIHILNNKGFKKCDKKLKEQTPRCDLIDCFIKIFKHAEDKNYGNILILEDDFVFNEKIKETTCIEEITEFVNKRTITGSNFIYLLGCIPYLQIPSIFHNHTRVIFSTGTHSSIYSKEFRRNVLCEEQDKITDWDLYTNINSPFTSRYIYKTPLCYQLFYETDNYKSWDDSYNFKYIIMNIFKMLNMDNKPEPGFTFFYVLSRILYFLLIILFYYSVKTIIDVIILVSDYLFFNKFNFFFGFFINKF